MSPVTIDILLRSTLSLQASAGVIATTPIELDGTIQYALRKQSLHPKKGLTGLRLQQPNVWIWGLPSVSTKTRRFPNACLMGSFSSPLGLCFCMQPEQCLSNSEWLTLASVSEDCSPYTECRDRGQRYWAAHGTSRTVTAWLAPLGQLALITSPCNGDIHMEVPFASVQDICSHLNKFSRRSLHPSWPVLGFLDSSLKLLFHLHWREHHLKQKQNLKPLLHEMCTLQAPSLHMSCSLYSLCTEAEFQWEGRGAWCGSCCHFPWQ